MSFASRQYFKKLWALYIIQSVVILAIITIIIQVFLGIRNAKGYVLAPIVIATIGVVALKAMYTDQVRNIDDLGKLENREGKGYRAEEKMKELLETLPSEFKITNNYPKDYGDIDHVIVGPTGVFCIETKGSIGMVGFHNNHLYINMGSKYSTKYIGQCLDGKKYIENLIYSKSGKKIRVNSILAFPFATIDKTSINSPINGIWVAEGAFAIELIKHHKDFLNVSEIRKITSCL